MCVCLLSFVCFLLFSVTISDCCYSFPLPSSSPTTACYTCCSFAKLTCCPFCGAWHTPPPPLSHCLTGCLRFCAAVFTFCAFPLEFPLRLEANQGCVCVCILYVCVCCVCVPLCVCVLKLSQLSERNIYKQNCGLHLLSAYVNQVSGTPPLHTHCAPILMLWRHLVLVIIMCSTRSLSLFRFSG